MIRNGFSIFLKINRLTILAVIMLFVFKANGQTISVTNFYLAENDLTAQGRNTSVLDQNGDRCALIRVQTTQKGFFFDVGSAGVQKVDDTHAGEIWVYVPYGVRHMSIRHPQLGSLPNYDFPIDILKAKTYIMEITSDKVFVNNYDDTQKQMLLIKVTPPRSTLTLNGMSVPLDNRGEAEQELSFGTYTYKVESEGFYPKEGQVTIDDPNKKQTLTISGLMPITGKLSVHVNPYMADVKVDGTPVGDTSLDPKELQIGTHEVVVSAKGYRPETRTVTIEEDKTTDISVNLSQVAVYRITSNPTGAYVYINKTPLGTTPCSKELTTGNYHIKATKVGYKDYEKDLALSSSSPNVEISLNKIYNYKTEFYIEANANVGSFLGMGATLGGFIHNINVEASYLYGMGKSESIYWSGNNSMPVEATYSPNMCITGKVGYGVAFGTRYRIAPQLGLGFVKLKETMVASSRYNPADGANAISGIIGLRFSAAIMNHFGVSLSPSFSIPVKKSKGFEALSNISSKIKNWGGGFNVKLGIAAFF